MKPFTFERASTVAGAVNAAATSGGSFYAGGTNLLDLMKRGVTTPDVLIDVAHLGLDEVTTTPAGGVLLGAGVTNSAAANHPLIRSQYPVVSHAILSGATTQLRNMATVGGNLLQRPRCPYFMDPAFPSCAKRDPDSGCGARSGVHREHAIFDTGAQCVAVHPSDLAVALAILDATVHVHGPAGRRTVPVSEFFDAADPRRETTLGRAELIVAVELPPSDWATNSWYLKVRDRHSYAFALVSVAVGLELTDGVIRSAGLALGGVAATPRRAAAAEQALVGSEPSRAVFRTAARLALAGAEPLPQNAFKVELGKHAVVRALESAVRPSAQ